MNTHYKANKHFVAVDCILFGFKNEELNVLLFKRKVEPFKGSWSLLGDFVSEKESIDNAARRVIEQTTGVSSKNLEQLSSFGELDRDPGGRVISISYFSVMKLQSYQLKTNEYYEAKWFSFKALPELILDHKNMIDNAMKKLKYNATEGNLIVQLLPKKFSIPQAQRLFESIYQKKYDSRNFRKKLLALKILIKLDEKNLTDSKKGANLYQFDRSAFDKKTLFKLNLI